jgi:predicted DNA-binding transcriptional regulator AlpA
MSMPASPSAAERPEASDPGLDTTRAGYTALHGSCAVCDWCGERFEPRIRAGPNADRFCQPAHRYAWWNRKRKTNPPAVGSDAAGDKKEEEVKAYRSTKLLRYVYLKRRGERLAFTLDEVTIARQRARKLETAAQAALRAGPFITFEETARVLGYRSRESVYHLVRRGFLPPPVVLSVTPRRVGWQTADVCRLLEQRQP